MTVQITEPSLRIQTERLLLRPLRLSDAGLLRLHTSDARVAMGTSSIPHPLPPGATEAFIAHATSGQGDEDTWVLDGSAAHLPEVMGQITLKRMDRAQAEVGYWVAPAFWNGGYASEALRGLIEANPRAYRTLFAQVFQDNPGSARVLTNCGFDYIGDAESFSVARGARVPTWTYLRKLA